MDNLSEALQQLLYDFLAFLPDFATALIIFIVSIYLAGLISRIIKGALERRKTDSAFVLLLVKIARYTMIGFGIFTALQQVGDSFPDRPGNPGLYTGVCPARCEQEFCFRIAALAGATL